MRSRPGPWKLSFASSPSRPSLPHFRGPELTLVPCIPPPPAPPARQTLSPFPQAAYARKQDSKDLRRVFDRIDTEKSGKLGFQELKNLFDELSHPAKKKDIEDMIWEVDEDCDKKVSWSEFQSMFTRAKEDKSGYEPRKLYNVVEFLMNDKDDSGSVSLEEAMQPLFLRYGREMIDVHLEEMFGTSDVFSGKELCLTEYLDSLHTIQIKQITAKITAKTFKAPMPKAKTRK